MFPKIIISSVLEVNVNVMGQKENQEQRVERDLESCGQGNFLTFDLTDKILGFAPWEAPRETSGLRMEKRPKFLNVPPSGMLKIALQAWLSPVSNDSNTSHSISWPTCLLCY